MQESNNDDDTSNTTATATEVAYSTTLYYTFGFESVKRNNLHFIEDYVIVLSSGNTLNFFDLKSQKYTWIEVKGQSGIGSIAVCKYYIFV
jgi:hypothetical protein